jgi:hypothetical protein
MALTPFRNMKTYPNMTIIYLLKFQTVLVWLKRYATSRKIASSSPSWGHYSVSIRIYVPTGGRSDLQFAREIKPRSFSFFQCVCVVVKGGGAYIQTERPRDNPPRRYKHHSFAIFYDYPVIGNPPSPQGIERGGCRAI